MRRLLATGLLVMLAAATPAGAQEWQVARETFPFAGTRLTIRVEAESAGTLRVIRGGYGAVRVASRAAHGFAGGGLAGNDELTLSAAGDGPVDYLVSVPYEVWIDVRLPDRARRESVAAHARSRTFEWEHSARRIREPVAEWVPPLDEQAPLFTTFAQPSAPSVVNLPDLSTIRSLTVRIEGNRFRVMTSRPLSVQQGGQDRLEIRAEDPPMDVVLTVPLRTHDIRIDAGGRTALILDAGDITTLCSPVTRQWLSNGRRWVTFSTVDGSLECAPPAAPRHEH